MVIHFHHENLYLPDAFPNTSDFFYILNRNRICICKGDSPFPKNKNNHILLLKQKVKTNCNLIMARNNCFSTFILFFDCLLKTSGEKNPAKNARALLLTRRTSYAHTRAHNGLVYVHRISHSCCGTKINLCIQDVRLN